MPSYEAVSSPRNLHEATSGHNINDPPGDPPNSPADNSQRTTSNSYSGDVAQTLNALDAEDPLFHQIFHVRNLERGQVVATPHDLIHKMYVLMNGRVNMVCSNNEGRRLVISTLENGAVFGEGALDMPHDEVSIFAEAATPISIWAISEDDARNLTIQYPILGWGLLQTYGERLLQVENGLEDVAYKKLPERLAALLLEMSDYENEVIRGVSHQSLADHLGTYRETVSAILRDFKRQAYVELGYRRIRVLDAENLKDLAGIWEY